MNRPEVKVNGSVHIYAWEQEGVTIRMDRLHEDSKGVVTGEITVRSTMGHIHQARLNLTSTRSRADVAKQCATRLEWDWPGALEMVCVLTLQALREGEPVIRIGDLPPSDRLLYRIEPLILERQPNLLYGPGGTGKSTIALYLAALTEIPWPENGLGPEPGKVLYWDFEASAEEIQGRMTAIYKGLGREHKTDLLYRYCSQPVVNEIELLQRIIAEEELDLLIIDSGAYAVGGEPESAAATTAYWNALRTLKITTLTIAHVSKENTGPFGSIFWTNGARSSWEITSSQEEGAARNTIGLFHRKMNNGRKHRPLGFHIDYQEGAIQFTKTDPYNDPQLSKKGSLRERLLRELSKGGMTVKALAENVEKTDAEVRTELNRAKDVFVKTPGKRGEEEWGLLYRERDEKTT